jgi:FKBP-type peptidyl-prolyl cis-trans isomerase
VRNRKRSLFGIAAALLAIAAVVYWRHQPRAPEGGVEIEELRAGKGEELRPGNTVTVHYTAKVQGGSVYSESRKLDQPFTFVVGKGQVLPGWERGIEGMRPGELRRIIIPPALAYGEIGAPPLIPPHATLEVEIELLRVSSASR